VILLGFVMERSSESKDPCTLFIPRDRGKLSHVGSANRSFTATRGIF
jgi:hypothetical protein